MKLVTPCLILLFCKHTLRVDVGHFPRAEHCFRRLKRSFLFTDTCVECGVMAKALKYSSSLKNWRNYGNVPWNYGFTFKDFLCELDIIWILRAGKHNRSLVHQHNMEMNIPLAVETNLWDCTLIAAVRNVPQPSEMLDRQCALYQVTLQRSTCTFLRRAEWSGVWKQPCCTNFLSLIIRPIIQSNTDGTQ